MWHLAGCLVHDAATHALLSIIKMAGPACNDALVV
jgi:hypothetical protein